MNILFLRKKPTTHFFLNFPPENNNIQSHQFHKQPPKSSKSRKHCKPHVKNAKKTKKMLMVIFLHNKKIWKFNKKILHGLSTTHFSSKTADYHETIFHQTSQKSMTTSTINIFSIFKKNYGSHFFGKNRAPCKNRILTFFKKRTSYPMLKIQKA